MSCSAAMPATSAWVPSPPATPSRSAPSATASPDQRGDIDVAGSVEQGHPGAERLGLVLQVELDDLAAAGPRVHHDERLLAPQRWSVGIHRQRRRSAVGAAPPTTSKRTDTSATRRRPAGRTTTTTTAATTPRPVRSTGAHRVWR